MELLGNKFENVDQNSKHIGYLGDRAKVFGSFGVEWAEKGGLKNLTYRTFEYGSAPSPGFKHLLVDTSYKGTSWVLEQKWKSAAPSMHVAKFRWSAWLGAPRACPALWNYPAPPYSRRMNTIIRQKGSVWRVLPTFEYWNILYSKISPAKSRARRRRPAAQAAHSQAVHRQRAQKSYKFWFLFLYTFRTTSSKVFEWFKRVSYTNCPR